ncbi:MAG: PDZ domain-containing protein, partial [Acidobacteriota bacterium]
MPMTPPSRSLFDSSPDPHTSMASTVAAALLTMTITWLVTWPLAGQTRTIMADAGLVIRELGAICEMTDIGLSVQMAMPAESRPEAYRALDLREGDVIMAWNGQRLREIDTARMLYEEAAPGSTVALGVDREGQKRILRFAKADPADLPERMVFQGASGSRGMVMRTVDVGGELVMVSGLGMLAEDHDDVVRVAVVLPTADTALHEQDLVVEIGGTAIESAEQLAEMVDAVEIGDTMAVVLHRDGESVTVE